MLDEILAILFRPITERLDQLMATADELKAQVAEVKESLQSAVARIEADFEALKAKLGDQIDPADLDPISAGLAELKSSLDALDPDPDNPPTS